MGKPLATLAAAAAADAYNNAPAVELTQRSAHAEGRAGLPLLLASAAVATPGWAARPARCALGCGEVDRTRLPGPNAVGGAGDAAGAGSTSAWRRSGPPRDSDAARAADE